MSSPHQPAGRICTTLNTAAATVWVLLLLERSSWGRSSISDYGAAWGLVGLFFSIPLGAFGVWRLLRRRPDPLSRSRRRYLCLSAAFLGVTWIVSCIPIVFWAGLLGAAASHFWPLNAREGPDTAFAKERFREHFGFPPASLDGLYCRRGWEFGDGNTYRMKFHFQDLVLIESMVRSAGLEPVPEGELQASWVVELDTPNWWPQPGFRRYHGAFQRQSRPRLWVDRENNLAYYRSWP